MYGHAETQPAVYAETSARSAFIRRTYVHLAGAVLSPGRRSTQCSGRAAGSSRAASW